MPNYFMPAKNPDEVRDFFNDLVDQGKMKLTLATERPDVYDRIQPTEEVRLIVDAADRQPPEGVDFDKVLGEFRPTPLPEEQLASWSDEIPEPTEATEAEPSDDVVTIEESASSTDVQDEAPEVAKAATDGGILDRPWTPFASRGFKGGKL